ncbi:MAG: hypothetical protein ABJA61_08920 [Caldimonas sp.]
MSKQTLSAILTFAVLAGGTAAIGSEMFGHRAAAPVQMARVTLPGVTIIGHREVPMAEASLPTVMVIGHREALTEVAVETRASEARRVE